jgi:hypothetical protein
MFKLLVSLLKKLFKIKSPVSEVKAPEINPEIKKYSGNEPDDVDNPEWTPILVLADGIEVTWKEKYGEEKKATGIGLWYSKKKDSYMISQRSAEAIIIEKSNMNDLQYKGLKG